MNIESFTARLQAIKDQPDVVASRWPRDRDLYFKFPNMYDRHTPTYERFRHAVRQMCTHLVERDIKVLDQETQSRAALDPRKQQTKTWLVYMVKIELNQEGEYRRLYRGRRNQTAAKKALVQKKWDKRWPVLRETIYLSLSEFQYDTLRHTYNLYNNSN